jgi:polyisoprenyl-phosphate glycosyltransferase
MDTPRVSAVESSAGLPTRRSSVRSPSSTLTVVAPVYNEVEGIAHFVHALLRVMDQLPYTYTLLLVDDGGTDGTGPALDTLQAEHPDRISVIHFSRNFGHQAALTAGMDYAEGDAVICLDADMQHPPEIIPQLVARWEDGVDIVQATRAEEPTASMFKHLTARVFYSMINRLSATRIEPNAADFRLLSRRVADSRLIIE